MAHTATNQSAREASLARRRALTSQGKAALGTMAKSGATPASQSGAAGTPGQTGRAASRARREAMSSQGKAGIGSADRTRHTTSTPSASSAPAATDCGCGCDGKRASAEGQTESATLASSAISRQAPSATAAGTARAASLARREAMSQRGKAGLSTSGSAARYAAGGAGSSAASSRDRARALREERSRTGKASQNPTPYSGQQAAAQDAVWKVAASETEQGQTITGSIVGRSRRVTGDEPGTCKRITGDEYVGAEQAELFCSADSKSGSSRITSSQGRRGRNTGSDSSRDTGNSRKLLGAQSSAQRGNGAGSSRGNITITGALNGHSDRVTGNETGNSRHITGNDYAGNGQRAAANGQRTGSSTSLRGNSVTGDWPGRSSRVTGDEPGTCKAVTGTPYAGADQYNGYCKADEAGQALARTRKSRRSAGAVMTGQQPGVGGKLTGAGKGACEPVSGTPYVGADQYASVCPASPAETNSPDFPQPLGNTPWGQFSVTTPAGEARDSKSNRVTGSQYEQGQITGPFGMATGKVTGTEEARFDHKQPGLSTRSQPVTLEMIEGRVKSRITGEGMDAGAKITGDDWERGDNVTGTEGTSAIRRNQTFKANSSFAGMPMAAAAKRNEPAPVPVSKVTGGSGNTEKGALVTYSGGARG